MNLCEQIALVAQFFCWDSLKLKLNMLPIHMQQVLKSLIFCTPSVLKKAAQLFLDTDVSTH
jgi:hypothetical protein